jgi:AcrR family transcriptional regulator
MLGPKDNTVNIKDTRASYHHGDLRDALVETGIAMLERDNVETLSLRGIARAAGVSATAVYRHFPDKDSLLRAIAALGFKMMRERQSEAAAAAAVQGTPAAFAAVGAAYVAFALKHPAIFRLMFACAPPRDLFSIDRETLSGPLRILRDHVAALSPPDAPESAQTITAIRAWSLVHGMAVLALDHMIPNDPALIQAVIQGAGIGKGGGSGDQGRGAKPRGLDFQTLPNSKPCA